MRPIDQMVRQVLPKRICNSLLAVVGVALLSAAAYWSVRLARADAFARDDSEAGLAAALRLAPRNAGYLVRLADFREARGQPAPGLLDAALSLNPNDATAWMRRGLQSEMSCDLAGAERDLLRAATVSAQYEPRWTLANFYFRHRQPDAFWKWTRLALRRSYADRRPLFDLCWRVTDDPDTVTRALPPEPAAWRDYLDYLVAGKRLEAALPVALHIVDTAGPNDLPLLLWAGNTWLAARSCPAALTLWNGLCARRLLPYEPLAPARGLSLTNGGFTAPFAEGGFDWRAPTSTGLSTVRGAALFHASFSGRQPESVEVLWQYLPLEPGRGYVADFEYRTEDIAPATGLRWRVVNAAGVDLAVASPHLSSNSWKNESIVFAARDNTLARLVLCYRREPGTTRIEGAVSLRHLTLRFLP
jgi:hypothetical protein